MKTKKIRLVVLVSAFSICASMIAAFAAAKNLSTVFAQNNYGVTFDNSNRVTEVTDGVATKSINTLAGYPISFKYTGASVVAGKHVGLAANGSIENLDLLMGSSSVTATFSGSLDVYGSGDRYEFTRLGALSSGVKFTYDKTWDYVKLVATAVSEIDSIQLTHTCTTRFTGVEDANYRIVGFDSVTNIGPLNQSGNRGWGSKFWAAMNFDNGQGGRFHFYSPLGGEHEIDWYFQSAGGTYLNVFLNGTQVDDVTVPATGTWYSDSSPTGQKVAVNYNLLQGWNELYYLAPDITHGDGQYAQIGAIEIIGLTNRRYDPSELDTDIHTLHFEAEQGYYVGKDDGSRFYDYTNYSGGELLGKIEANGCGSGVTFQLPSQGAGQYDFTARIGCGGGTTVKVFVDDFTNEWSNNCTTTAYQIDNISASANWNVMKTTPSLRVTLPSGWCRIRVEYGGQWFTLDSFDLVKVVE